MLLSIPKIRLIFGFASEVRFDVELSTTVESPDSLVLKTEARDAPAMAARYLS